MILCNKKVVVEKEVAEPEGEIKRGRDQPRIST